MKKTILVTSLMVMLAATPAMAQMMGGQGGQANQQMMGDGQDSKSSQQVMEQQRNESAQEVLEKRFAKGEISKEEFEDAIEVLKRNKE